MRLVYLAPVPYASFAQRPHKFVRYFNDLTGGSTLWINPYPGRLPNGGDLGRLLAPLWNPSLRTVAPRVHQSAPEGHWVPKSLTNAHRGRRNAVLARRHGELGKPAPKHCGDGCGVDQGGAPRNRQQGFGASVHGEGQGIDPGRALDSVATAAERNQPIDNHSENPAFPSVAVTVCSVMGCDPLMGFSAAQQIAWRRVLGRVGVFVEDDDWLLAIGRPSRLALYLLSRTVPTASCYDAMDDFPEFYGGVSRYLSRKLERHIARSVDTIIVTSEGLRRKFASWDLACDLVRNGFDAAWTMEPSPAPRVPVFGYVGTLGAWFDWELLGHMALALPQVHFQLFGPVRSRIPRLPGNVQLRGECGHAEVPKILSGFTAGLIPFKVNSLTAAVDPIKYFEYRACGLPVISSKFGDMARRGAQTGVHLIDRCTDYGKLFARVVATPRDSGDLLSQFRAENSWETRFAGCALFHESSRSCLTV